MPNPNSVYISHIVRNVLHAVSVSVSVSRINSGGGWGGLKTVKLKKIQVFCDMTLRTAMNDINVSKASAA